MRGAMLVWLVLFTFGWLSVARGEESPANTPAAVPVLAEEGEDQPYNVKWSTLGGKQFWTDYVILADYRIQRHSASGHWRLLDPENVRLTWGTREQCEARLDELRREKQLAFPRGKVVIALHGLLRTREQVDGLREYLEREGGYAVLDFGYASSRAEIGDHAEALANVIDQCCRDATEINFVGHSLGNIIVRHYLADAAESGKRPDPRIGRVVMLGPPNNGAELAVRFRNHTVFQVMWGRPGKQLAEHWDGLRPCLATPHCPFGIIAGGLGTKVGMNPLVTGDDDGVVSVDETRLPGAADFLVLPVIHGKMMDDEAVRRATLSFLKHGYFVAEQQRQPIPAKAARKATDER